MAVVLGSVWNLQQCLANRPAWCCVRLPPCVSGRQGERRRVLLPGGESQQRLRPDHQLLRRRVPLCPAPKSVSLNGQSGAVGALPENVSYAVKSSFLLSFLESVPDVSAKLKAPVTADRKFEDVVKSAQEAVVLVLVY